MLFIATILCFAISARIGYSQSVSSETAPSSTSSASAAASSSTKAVQVHTVSVGKAQNQFEPDTIEADIGDIIEYQFFPPNHSVARAEYLIPCIPYEDTGKDKVGFWSGFNPVNTILSNPPTWNLTVNDTSPVFFFCAAPGSCQTWGMVGVINPNATTSLDMQKTKAKQAPYIVAPGESLPSAEVSSLMPTGTSAPSSSTTSTGSSSSQTAAAAHSSRLSSGAIAGIVIGTVIVTCLIGALLYFFGRHRTMIQFLKRDHHVSTQQPPGGPGMMAAHNSPFSPQTPSMPYSPADPRFGDYSTHDVPPYPKYSEPPNIAELSSPELESYRPSSPYSDTTAYDGSHRVTSSPPPPHNIMDSLDTKGTPQRPTEPPNQ